MDSPRAFASKTLPPEAAKPFILVIDDEPGHRLMVRAVLEDVGWTVLEAADGNSGLEACRENISLDAVLLDIRLPDQDGTVILQEIKAMHPQLPVVMLTAFGNVGSAVEAMKLGAFDYLTKPADNEELKAVLLKAREYLELVRENQNLRRALGEEDGSPRLIGQSPAMLRVVELIHQVGPTEATVLVTGESGTGKELVVQAIHESSLRRDGPLVEINCAALPGELLESELFGYVKGAFTGAAINKPGRFQLADKGTLFLDEIGDMPPALQAKLLRTLQERRVEPLGGTQSVFVDVRIVAATHQDLGQLVISGVFREDLYFRLNVLEIRLPPLRERLEDLPLLTRHLLYKLSLKNRKPFRDVGHGFLETLAAYRWPGNVRELENVLERALILARSDMLTPDLLPEHVREAKRGVTASGTPRVGVNGDEFRMDIGDAPFEAAERQVLITALEDQGGHRGRAAQALGISRRTLQYKLAKHGLTSR